MSVRTKQLGKIQRDLSLLALPARVKQIRDAFVGVGPAPAWYRDLPDGERDALCAAFWLTHPVLALTLNKRWAEDLSPETVPTVWAELVLLDDRRGQDFVGVGENDRKGVRLDEAEAAVAQVLAAHRTH